LIIETGISLDSQVNSQNSTTSLNEYKLATETTDENITQFNRISFSHDVQPEQKHHYLSNKYNIDGGSDENGGISYIQGVKTEEEKEKRLQVLPHLLVSLFIKDSTTNLNNLRYLHHIVPSKTLVSCCMLYLKS